MNYKIRSIKVAHRTNRNNPFRALMVGTAGGNLPRIGGVDTGSPLTDNALSVLADGRMKYAVGWGMLWRSPSLHPIAGMAF